MAMAVLAAAAVFHVMGLIDDRRRLGPYSKLLVQLLVAAALAIFFDMRILMLLDAWGAGGRGLSVAVSVLWIAAITNAINFLDNMDGLSAGVSAIIAGLYLAATLIGGQWFVAALCALLLGSLLAFLAFNFPPAKVFMGDGGSLVVGLLLAVISVRTTYVDCCDAASASHSGSRGWYGVLMPLVVMAVPLYDIASVTLIRLSQGKSPFYPDQQHFSHRLVKKGLSKRTAVMLIWLCTLATGLGGVMLGRVEGWQAALIAGQTAAVVAVLGMWERSGAEQISKSGNQEIRK
jgi:UDP-GlcNAc:undecaprenyl-phosphate GlcNAc-1-phosphate transferase